MTFKKKSELDLDKDSGSNETVKDKAAQDNKASNVKKKHRLSSGAIFVLVLVALILFWAITTIVIPLNRSSGAEKYTGDFRELAEGIYEFESSQKAGDPMPTWLEQYHIEDIHLTTDEERAQYCTDYPERMTTDPNRTMSYTVVYSEQSLGTWSRISQNLIGCQGGIPNRWIFDQPVQ